MPFDPLDLLRPLSVGTLIRRRDNSGEMWKVTAISEGVHSRRVDVQLVSAHYRSPVARAMNGLQILNINWEHAEDEFVTWIREVRNESGTNSR